MSKKKIVARKTTNKNEEILSDLKKGINEKIQYFSFMLNDHYENEPNFHLTRDEFNFLINFINKDNIYMSESPMFKYQGKRFDTVKFNVKTHGSNLISLNWIFVFFNIGRNDVGELDVIGKVLTDNELL